MIRRNRSHYLILLSVISLVSVTSLTYAADTQTIDESTKLELQQLILWSLSDDAKSSTLTLQTLPHSEKDDLGNDPAFRAKYDELRSKKSKVIALITSAAPEYGDALKDVLGRLTPSQLRDFILHAYALPTADGDTLSVMQAIIKQGSLEPGITYSQLAIALESASAFNGGVAYDGQLGRFVYSDSDLEFAVATVAIVAANNPVRFQKVLGDLTSEIRGRYRRNTNTADEQSRTEPFDLLQGAILRQIYARWSWSFNKIPLTKAIHKALFTYLNMGPDDDHRAQDIPEVIVDQQPSTPEEINIICASQLASFEDLLDADSYQGDFITAARLNLWDVYNNSKDKALSFKCGQKSYPVTVLQDDGEPLPLPPDFDISEMAQRGKVQVLVTYALTEESDQKLLAAAIAYLSSRGWVYHGMESGQKTEAVFERYFTQSDIYVPAAHLIDINHLLVGLETSVLLRFARYYIGPNHQLIPVELVATFPQKLRDSTSNRSVTITRPKLAELLSRRRVHRPDSLFVLTSSCQSASSVFTWTNAYRDSLDLDIKDGKLPSIAAAKDLIHAVGFGGGLPTSTPSDLVYDFLPALMTVDMLATGRSPLQVVNALSQPLEADLFTKGLRLVERIFGVKQSKATALKLDPVYNQAEPRMLKGGVSISIGEPIAGT